MAALLYCCLYLFIAVGAVVLIFHLDNLCHNADCNFLGKLSAKRDSDGGMNLIKFFQGIALLQEIFPGDPHFIFAAKSFPDTHKDASKACEGSRHLQDGLLSGSRNRRFHREQCTDPNP